MKAFAYVTARSPESAVELVADRGRYLSGGIDLLGELKEYLAEAATLVNVKELPGARDITPGAKVWTVGAAVTLADLAAHAGVRREFTALAEAAEHVGSPPMRHVATVGGNLAQHSRCWYYRHRDVRCLKRGGSRCYARGGDNRYHALFTGCQCLSPCVSNLAVALAVLEARVVVQRGRRTVTLPLADVYKAAWSGARVHHSLEAGDLILRVELPVVPGRRSAYLQQGERSDFDWALVSCAASGRLENGRLRDAHLALGCVAPDSSHGAQSMSGLASQPGFGRLPAMVVFSMAPPVALPTARAPRKRRRAARLRGR